MPACLPSKDRSVFSPPSAWPAPGPSQDEGDRELLVVVHDHVEGVEGRHVRGVLEGAGGLSSDHPGGCLESDSRSPGKAKRKEVGVRRRLAG